MEKNKSRLDGRDVKFFDAYCRMWYGNERYMYTWRTFCTLYYVIKTKNNQHVDIDAMVSKFKEVKDDNDYMKKVQDRVSCWFRAIFNHESLGDVTDALYTYRTKLDVYEKLRGLRYCEMYRLQ